MKKAEESDKKSPLGVDNLVLLGKGSYGVVYKGSLKGTPCVVKRVDISCLEKTERDDACKEAMLMGKLQHPNVVRFIDATLSDKTLSITMEYCSQGDLLQFLKQHRRRKEPLAERTVWQMFVQIALGLYHIHQAGILHRDLKPANIFLDDDFNVKIGDLGVAKLLGNAKFASTVVGSPLYMSPELVLGRPYDAKTDVWALGCILYEMCSFKTPFEASSKSMVDVANNIVSESVRPIPLNGYSKELQAMVDGCLIKKPSARKSMGQLLSDKCLVAKATELGLALPELRSSSPVPPNSRSGVTGEP